MGAMVSVNSPVSVALQTELLQAWMGYRCHWVEELSAEVCNFEGFIKHPPEIPLDFSLEPSPQFVALHLVKLHEGGMVFGTDTALPIGARIQLTINLKGLELVLHGLVTHCILTGQSRCDVGVQFENDNEHYAMRMIEQACHIEHYRGLVKKAGRELSEHEAAAEWIAQFASCFPR
jgi:hypothetical protein